MRITTAALAALLLACAACASSTKAGEGDGGTGGSGSGSGAIDATPSSIDAAPDGPPKAGFGQACSDGADCQSQICILAGTHGVCSRLCSNDCPDPYSCLGVDGVVVEGTVSMVCVPLTNQLCSPCVQDSECAQLGMDKCLTFPDGDRACGEDCTTIDCPASYSCQNVDIDNVNYKQCEPVSNACDCTAATPGITQTCSIATTNGACAGTQTCAGAAGWGSCAPPSSADDPDDAYTDSNCDGVDGDAAHSIFVSTGGSNTLTCGLSRDTPCQTIAWGITRAGQEVFSWVLVQNGTYAGGLAMKDGINVVGGYNTTWKRDAYTVSGHTVTISGGNPAVTFMNLPHVTQLIDVVVLGGNGSAATPTSSAGSAVGIFVIGSAGVQLVGVGVTPGVGGAGRDGGTGGTGIDGTAGGDGNPGFEWSDSWTCDENGHPARGTAGGASCGHPGGLGGNAGVGSEGTYGGPGWGQDGTTGTSGAIAGTGAHCNGDTGGIGDTGINCKGKTGGDGSIGSTGGGGSAGINTIAFSGVTFFPRDGGTAATGTSGNGGAGGGGGGGGTTACDSTGSSGGGGGGGGCGGGGGGGGTGGGASFAIVASDSLMVIGTSQVTSSSGGTGGHGGPGGMYGAGGVGGHAGPNGDGGGEQDDGGPGGGGGHGGHGGTGGVGGGGGGGPSIPVVCFGTSQDNVIQNGSTFTAGVGGIGGVGGNNGLAGQNPPSLNCNAL